MESKNFNIAKSIKKLVFSNRFTLEDISNLLNLPIEECTRLYEKYYNSPIPISLFIVGNLEARMELKESINKGEKVLLTGSNGVGKTSAVRELSQNLDLHLKSCLPLSQSDIVKSFGRGPTNEVDSNMYVIECDSLPKRHYSILLEYVKNSNRPLILIATDKKRVHGNVLKHLKKITFTPPSFKDVEIFLKKKYAWEGDINDIYHPDMRIVLERVINNMKSTKPVMEEKISSETLAFDLSCGYFNKKEFNRLKDPLWFVIRWLAYNQDKKLPKLEDQVANLHKLSIIDTYKFKIDKSYLEEMLLKLKPSPRRARFVFPPFKKKMKQEREFQKIKKPKGFKPRQIIKKPRGVDLTKWF